MLIVSDCLRLWFVFTLPSSGYRLGVCVYTNTYTAILHTSLYIIAKVLVKFWNLHYILMRSRSPKRSSMERCYVDFEIKLSISETEKQFFLVGFDPVPFWLLFLATCKCTGPVRNIYAYIHRCIYIHSAARHEAIRSCIVDISWSGSSIMVAPSQQSRSWMTLKWMMFSAI